MGIGVSATVLATMFTSTTLLPALLGFARGAGRAHPLAWPHRRRLHVRRPARARHRVRAARRLRRRASPSSPCSPAWPSGRCGAPVPRRVAKPMRSDPTPTGGAAPSSATRCRWLVGATVVLVLLAAPVASIRLGWADEGNFPEGTDTRQAYDLLAEGFGDGFNGPFLITVVPASPPTPSPPLHAALGAHRRRRRRHRPDRRRPGPAGCLPHEPRRHDRTPGRSHQPHLVRRLRADVIPAAVGRHRPRRRRSPEAPPSPSTSPTTSPSGCSSSSAPCWPCRSCC